MGSSLLDGGKGLAILNQDPPKLITSDTLTSKPFAQPLPDDFFRFIDYSNSLLK